MNVVAATGISDRRSAPVVDPVERIRASIELNIDKPNLVSGRPLDRVFERQFSTYVDTDPTAQAHITLHRSKFAEPANAC